MAIFGYTGSFKTLLDGLLAGKDPAGAAAAAQAAAVQRTNHTGTQTSATVSDFVKAAQDAAAAMFRAGTNVTFTYDDAANTFTINASGGGAGTTDPEVVRDTIGGALVGGANIQITVNDAADTITIAVTGLAAVATSGAYSDLTGKPAATSLTQNVNVITSSATAVIGARNSVNASAGPVVVTLPAPTAVGQQLIVERSDTSTVAANVVSITGTMRGNPATVTFPAVGVANEGILLEAESLTSWAVASSHKSKAWLDALYAAKSTVVTPTLDSQPTVTPTTIASDQFIGTAQTALTAHTTDQGAAWTSRSGSAYVLDGNGKATFANTSFVDNSISTFDAGSPNFSMSCDLTPVGTSASDQGAAGLVVRWVSTSNYYYISIDIVNKLVRIYKASALISMISVPSIAGGVTTNVKVDAYGPDITVTVNGVEKITFDDLTNMNSRNVGLRSGKSGTPVAIPTWGRLTLTTYSNTRMNWPRFQKGFTGNPLVALGAASTYDSTDINNPNVVWDPVNNRHVLYYTAYYDSGAHNGQQKMALAYSTTGPMGPYVKEAANPVYDSYATDNNTENGGFCFAVGLRTWFHAYHAGSNQKRIGLASATTPTSWTRIGYLPSTGGTWDAGGQYDPFMRVREDGVTLECWYAGADTSGVRSIGRMTSIDGGQTWLTESSPVITNPGISAVASFAEPSVYVPPSREGQQMLIFYDICPITSSTSRVIGCAMTIDGGATWKHKIVLTAGTASWESNQVFDSFPYYENGRLYLFHSGAPAAGLVLNIGIQIGVDAAEWDSRTLLVNSGSRTTAGTAVSAT